jgi:hypothetical protein
MAFKSLAAAKAYLLRLNIKPEELQSIENIEDANEMIAVLEGEVKKNAKLDEKKTLPLPEVHPIVPGSPEAKNNAKTVPTDDEPYSAEEIFDPRQVDVSRCNKYNDDDEIRILKVYDDESPEGRVV